MKLLLTLILTATIGLIGCGDSTKRGDDHSGGTPKAVTLAATEKISASSQEEFMGTVFARSRANIGAKIQAPIERIAVTLGSRVKQGDPLAELDRPKLEGAPVHVGTELVSDRHDLGRAAGTRQVFEVEDVGQRLAVCHKVFRPKAGGADDVVGIDAGDLQAVADGIVGRRASALAVLTAAGIWKRQPVAFLGADPPQNWRTRLAGGL